MAAGMAGKLEDVAADGMGGDKPGGAAAGWG